jgi:hypothetical protein
MKECIFQWKCLFGGKGHHELDFPLKIFRGKVSMYSCLWRQTEETKGGQQEVEESGWSIHKIAFSCNFL